MLKNKIYKYFSIEVIKSFLTILFALSAIAWTVRAVSFLNLVVDNGHSITTYLQFSLLNITNIVTKFAPLSFLLALVLTILKFEKQNELIILWTNGLSKIKLVNLFFFISISILLFQLIFAVYITPNSLNKSRKLIRESDFNSLTSIVRINDFSDSFNNIIFYVEKKNDEGEMENVFIRDESNTFKSIVQSNGESDSTTIIAKKGTIDNDNLILFNGLIQTIDKNKKLNNIYFTKTILSTDSLSTRSITEPKLQETQTSMLIKCLVGKKNETQTILKNLPNCPKKNMIIDVSSTFLRRIGMPIYIPLVSIICCFVLISHRDKRNQNFYKYFYFTFGFLILILAEIMVRFSGFSKVHSLTYILFPVLMTPLVYLILRRKLKYEKRK